MRADARRNYERLLACAHEAFTEHGADASLEDIARRAGLGIGTLYRHFPNREALLVALLSARLRGLTTYIDELAGQEPAEAFANWVRASCEHGKTYRGIAIGVMSMVLGDRTEFDDACAAAKAAGDRVLVRAQEAGAVRPDITRAHLVALVQGLILATEDDPELFDTLLSVVLAGLSG
ncbi:TetR/AcrR family transcriptional regulator [Kutzneria buriramensis]|uniref:AcrR family transcriptional regulator n=1 Tax=Kutzneria buriramensis TaxID=1045776 RepID=A0A3E0H181_9PSEU|nr:TetR/AcrR family transcriptional regulator [Kutzneria buriramensis]REH35800.1 AcrR family transcriptional regulator [Kutzneria buriramensis]